MTEADLAKTLEGLLSAYRKPDSTTADAFALRSHMVAHADEIVAALHRTGQLIVAQAGDVPDDVRTLVIAAREAWESNGQSGDDLDRALEPFSSRVPYDDEPEHVA